MRARHVVGVLLGATLAACDPAYDLCATVTRCSDGDALVGVHVRILHDGEQLSSGYTDPDGRYCAAGMGEAPPSPVVVQYSKPGYVTLEMTYSHPAGELPAECLEVACDPSAGELCDAGAGAAGAPQS